MWRIELQCPQCGGPLVLDETDRVLACAYCRVRLFLAHRNTPVYYLAPPDAHADELLYVPYRRFRGMSFSFRLDGIAQRVIDSNVLALEGMPFPGSLGVRPQVLRLRHITPGMNGKFLSAGPVGGEAAPLSPGNGHAGTTSGNGHAGTPKAGNGNGRADTTKSGNGRTGTARPGPGESFCEVLIGEVESLVYAPTFVRGSTLYDAILQRPWKAAPGPPLELGAATGPPPCNIDFITMICPHCGWDLQGERDALIPLCRNCDSAWEVSGTEWQPVKFSVVRGDGETSIYLPFWRLEAKISGVRLGSFADLVRLANLPKAILGGWESQRIAFWSPAFKVHPRLFLRLARLLTLSQPDLASSETLPKADILSATLPTVGAGEFITAIIGSFATPRRTMIPMLPGIGVSVRERSLTYLPFTLRGTEYVQPALGLTINKTSLDMGRLI